MVRPGMASIYGQPVGRLEGPLRWAVVTCVARGGPELRSIDTWLVAKKIL